MDAATDGVALAICDSHPFGQRDKDVAIARHDDAVAGLAQFLFKALRNIERHRFFGDALAGNSATIETAMARVDHHGGKIPAC